VVSAGKINAALNQARTEVFDDGLCHRCEKRHVGKEMAREQRMLAALPSLSLTIGIVWGTGQDSTLSLLHGGNPHIPASNHLAQANLELERLVALARRVELVAIGKLASVVGSDELALLWGITSALLDNLLLELAWDEVHRLDGVLRMRGDVGEGDEGEWLVEWKSGVG